MSFNVLIVDDSNAMRAVIKKVIGLSGFKMDSCLEAGNGREAMELLSDQWVDVIISDINMPEVNGLEFLDLLKELIRTSFLCRGVYLAVSCMSRIFGPQDIGDGSSERIGTVLRASSFYDLIP